MTLAKVLTLFLEISVFVGKEEEYVEPCLENNRIHSLMIYFSDQNQSYHLLSGHRPSY